MNFRRALHEQAMQHGLDPKALSRLYQLAQLTTEPERLPQIWLKGCAIAGAALAGMAAIMWVAANWTQFGRYGRLALAEAFVLLPILLMLWRPGWRLPMALMALLGIGALLACVGQTYQTGADPWQLFALWALLALPLCLGARHDAVWTPWVLVVGTAVSLLQYEQLPTWYVDGGLLPLQLLAWMVAGVLVVALRHPAAQKLGIGTWPRGLSLIQFMLLITTVSVYQIWYHVTPSYWLALLTLAGAAFVLAASRYFDALGLVLALLAINALLDSGFVNLIVAEGGDGIVGSIFFILFFCAVVLGISTHWLMRAFKREGILK